MEPDRRYIVDFVSRINALEIEGRNINSIFQEGNAHSWWAFQQFFIFTQVEWFSSAGDIEKYFAEQKLRHGVISRILVASFYLLVIFATVVAVIGARLRNSRVVTFSSDFLDASPLPNPRMRNIYLFLHENNISYVEILHITSMSSFFKNICRRKTLSIYLEAFYIFAQVYNLFKRRSQMREIVENFDLSEFIGSEKKLAHFILEQAILRIEMSKTSVFLFQKLLRFLNAKNFLSVDDFRYIPELILACEHEKVHTHVFQHSNFGFLTGVFTLPPASYVFPSTFYTWSTYWQKRIQEISPFFAYYGKRILTGGRSFTPAQPTQIVRAAAVGKKNPLVVLVPYEVSVSKNQISPYMGALLSDPRIHVLFLPRGTIDQIDRSSQIEKYFDGKYWDSPQLRIIETSRREEAMRNCDLVAGVYSGFLDESLETGVPVCVFKTDFMNVNRLDTDNLATLIDLEKGDMYSQLLAAYHTPDDVLQERRKRVSEGVVDIKETLRKITKYNVI